MIKVMLTVVLIISAIAFISANDAETMLKQIESSSRVCIAQTKVNELQLLKLSMMQVTNDKESFCYLACVAKKIGIMNDASRINKDKIFQIYNILKPVMASTMYDKTIKVTNKCLTEVKDGGNECDVAKAAFACVIKYGKQESLFNF